MSRRGFPSNAHEYSKRDECVHCHMYRNNVERTNHECVTWRENQQDAKEAKDADMELADWRLGSDLQPRQEKLGKVADSEPVKSPDNPDDRDSGGALSQTTFRQTPGK